MKYKTMYGLHELRMWIGTIIAGTAAAVAITEAHPEIKTTARRKWSEVREKLRKNKKTDPVKIVVCDENGDPV